VPSERGSGVVGNRGPSRRQRQAESNDESDEREAEFHGVTTTRLRVGQDAFCRSGFTPDILKGLSG